MLGLDEPLRLRRGYNRPQVAVHTLLFQSMYLYLDKVNQTIRSCYIILRIRGLEQGLDQFHEYTVLNYIIVKKLTSFQ